MGCGSQLGANRAGSVLLAGAHIPRLYTGVIAGRALHARHRIKRTLPRSRTESLALAPSASAHLFIKAE